MIKKLKNLREVREKAALSREDVASQLKVSAHTVYRWESGEVEPHPVFFEKLKEMFENLETIDEKEEQT